MQQKLFGCNWIFNYSYWTDSFSLLIKTLYTSRRKSRSFGINFEWPNILFERKIGVTSKYFLWYCFVGLEFAYFFSLAIELKSMQFVSPNHHFVWWCRILFCVTPTALILCAFKKINFLIYMSICDPSYKIESAISIRAWLA